MEVRKNFYFGSSIGLVSGGLCRDGEEIRENRRKDEDFFYFIYLRILDFDIFFKIRICCFNDIVL